MRTLQLIDGDIAISNHNFVVLNDRNTLKQRIQNRLALYLGEFSLESSLGVDWFLLKEYKYNEDEIKKAILKELTKDSEIIGINSLEIVFVDTPEKVRDYGKPRRSILINWNVNTLYGEVSS